ncbi:MAG TPA: metallopeptidase TldD-related protein, partial [Candidatus Angelobacter sp.]
MRTLVRNLMVRSLAFCLMGVVASSAAVPPPAKDDVVTVTMQRELHRAQEYLGKLDPAPYFTSYSIHDDDLVSITASQGGIINSSRLQHRTADVVMRVGANTLDNSHGTNRISAISSGILPLEDDPDAITRMLWHLSYEEYRKATGAYLNVKSGTQVHAQEEDTSADFSHESPQNFTDYSTNSKVPEQAALEKMIRQYSAYFLKYPHIYSSFATLTVRKNRLHFVSTEGSVIVHPSVMVRLVIEAETRSDDGMESIRAETFAGESVEQLPGEAEIRARVEKMASDLKALRTAPLAEPFAGPALLSGRAAAVFFHEVLGHRLEGHRQRGEQEGQTFTKKINQQVLPEFLSVTDDPTERTLNGTKLAGWYQYDEEGV